MFKHDKLLHCVGISKIEKLKCRALIQLDRRMMALKLWVHPEKQGHAYISKGVSSEPLVDPVSLFLSYRRPGINTMFMNHDVYDAT